ncbi:MAG: Mov34/MPN/PAD-1 family protein [Mucilaginibacter sp.]
MIVKNDEIGLSFEIPADLIEKIETIGRKHYPNEFGGLLVGNYSADKKTVLVTETLLPKAYKSSKYSFERGSNGFRKKLLDLYNQAEPKFYVGEWHTHPNGRPNPSFTDMCALKKIADHEEVHITSPVMLIVGLNANAVELGFYVYFKNTIYRYETT